MISVSEEGGWGDKVAEAEEALGPGQAGSGRVDRPCWDHSRHRPPSRLPRLSDGPFLTSQMEPTTVSPPCFTLAAKSVLEALVTIELQDGFFYKYYHETSLLW